jgi:hypothetical protein
MLRENVSSPSAANGRWGLQGPGVKIERTMAPLG